MAGRSTGQYVYRALQPYQVVFVLREEEFDVPSLLRKPDWPIKGGCGQRTFNEIGRKSLEGRQITLNRKLALQSCLRQPQ